MSKIVNHPVLDVPVREKVTFRYIPLPPHCIRPVFRCTAIALKAENVHLPVVSVNAVPVKCWWTGRSGVFVSLKSME